MDFEQQKPITDEFRKGWERIYVQQEVRKVPKDWPRDSSGNFLGIGTAPNDGTLYRGGCPILSDGTMRDDL
jgi:hypothetical protein